MYAFIKSSIDTFLRLILFFLSINKLLILVISFSIYNLHHNIFNVKKSKFGNLQMKSRCHDSSRFTFLKISEYYFVQKILFLHILEF